MLILQHRWENNMQKKDDKIDIVVLWVDGNDPEWIKEKNKYDTRKKDNSASSNRFRDWDLMRYWFRGIEKYAPWVNHVHFVTCGHYPSWLNLNHSKISLVKHTDYIPNELLPTFNSNTIEMYIHLIPNLADKFILFNDDMFLIRPTCKEDFFMGDKPLESALLGILSSQDISDVFPHILINNSSILNSHFCKKKVLQNNKELFYSLKYGKDVIRNICLSPFVYFSDFRDLHLPTSYRKKDFEKVWEAEPQKLYEGTKSRFRSSSDINHWLIKDWYMCEGDFAPRKTTWGKRFELGCDESVYEYIKEQKGKVICLNDSNSKLDFEETQKKLIECFESILPNKSSFEK